MKRKQDGIDFVLFCFVCTKAARPLNLIPSFFHFTLLVGLMSSTRMTIKFLGGVFFFFFLEGFLFSLHLFWFLDNFDKSLGFGNMIMR